MIISHKYKYLFVETPQTGSTAISKELREHYDGHNILRKHSYYFEFERIANSVEKNYFVFAGVRNPLDETVSTYFKYFNDHRSHYTDSNKLLTKGSFVTKNMIKKYNFAQKKEKTFQDYVEKFYNRIYTNSVDINSEYCDYIIRFENLSEGFSEVLKKLNILQVRPLPQINKTDHKDQKTYEQYYTRDMRDHVTKVFGPFMKKWDYAFPDDWSVKKPSSKDLLVYDSLIKLRLIYVKHCKTGFLRRAVVIRNLIE
jgi:hypothetical protein